MVLPLTSPIASFSHFQNAIVKLLHQRAVKVIAEADKYILDGLRRIGFKLNMIYQLALQKLGGGITSASGHLRRSSMERSS